MILSASDCERIEKFWAYCQKHQYFNIGYPESADFAYYHNQSVCIRYAYRYSVSGNILE